MDNRLEQRSTIAERLRAAVASESWEEARTHWTAFSREVESALRARHPEAGRMMAEACELLDWARRMALISRAHAAARLRELERAGLYQDPPGRRSRWEISG